MGEQMNRRGREVKTKLRPISTRKTGRSFGKRNAANPTTTNGCSGLSLPFKQVTQLPQYGTTFFMALGTVGG